MARDIEQELDAIFALQRRNTSDGRGGNAVRDHALGEVSAESVKELVVDLVRELYGPF